MRPGDLFFGKWQMHQNFSYLARVSIPDKFILCFSFELLSNLFKKDVVHDTIHVPGYQKNHEPISDVGFGNKVVCCVFIILECFPGDKVPPEPRQAHDGDDVDGVEGSRDCQKDKPKPKCDVYLLIDDV